MSYSIAGTGSALPLRAVSNDQLGSFLETSDEWIRSRTGIAERHVLVQENLKDLAAKAGLDALRMAGIGAAELDLIICATTASDHLIPSLACEVQSFIGAVCPAFDINAACSGFLYSLDVAAGYFCRKPNSRILVIAADAMSRIVDWRQRSTCVLFGDGAGAVVLTGGDDLLSIQLSAVGDDKTIVLNGPKGNSPFAPAQADHPFVSMIGKEVYRFAVTSSARDLKRVLELANLEQEDVDLVLLHQANARIMDAVSSRLSIPKEKFVSNITYRGNTSAASIPILLDELNRQGRLKPGMVLAMSSFGGGLTTGACILRWQETGADARL